MQKKILQWAYVLMVASISLLMLIAVLLFAWHVEDATPWKSMEAGDWGVWVGSIGAVGAFFGTLWVATTQSRKERTQAQLHAAGFVFRIIDARGAVGRVCKQLSVDSKAGSDEVRVNRYLFDLNAINVWTVAELAPMTPLSPRAIGQLAEAGSQITSAIKALEGIRAGDTTLHTSTDRKAFAHWLHHLLSAAATRLDEGVRVCHSARHALHLNPE